MDRGRLIGKSVRLIAAVALVGCAAMAQGKPSTADNITESLSDVVLEYTGFGTSVSVHGVPIVRGSTLHAKVPGGANFHYMQEDLYRFKEGANLRTLPDGSRTFSVRHALTGERSGPFEATETLTLRLDNSVTARLDFAYHADTDTMIIWEAARILEDAFTGMPMKMEPAAASALTSVPTEMWPMGTEKQAIAKNFKSVEVASRMGPVRIETTPADADLAIEYRREQWVTFGPRNLFITLRKGPKVERDKVHSFEVTLRFPKELPAGAKGTASVVAKGVRVKDVTEVQEPKWGSDVLIPAPRSVVFSDARLALTSATRVVVGRQAPTATMSAARFLKDEIKRVTGVEVAISGSANPDEGAAIVLASGDEATSGLAPEVTSALGRHPESYELQVDAQGAVTASHPGTRGAYYAAATLAQLIHIDRDGPYLRGARISDQPAMDYRGVHLPASATGGRQIARAARELLARYKLNNLVWEGQFIKWDSQPDIHHPVFGMSQSDAKHVLATAREALLEVQPLVHSLGHSEWIFAHERNLDICEDPNRPYSYMPANPRTYEFIRTVYAEALELFTPVKEFHIGHDEFDMRGRVPNRSKSLGSVGDLFLYDVKKHYEFFKERGVRVMLWGDQLLAPGESADACTAPDQAEAVRRREALPKDMTIVDWHYAPAAPEKFTSLALFKKLGFDVIGAGWYTPANIRNLAAQCDVDDVRGYLQTTWAGFNFEVDGTPENWPQYWAYLLAAEHAWGGNKDNRALNNLPAWDPQETFMDTWFGREPVKQVAAGYTVDLAKARNRALADDDAGSGWMGYGSQFDLSAFEPGVAKLHGRLFDTSANEQGNVAVLLAGVLNPKGQWPASVSLKPEGEAPGKTRELHLLMAASIPDLDGTRIGEVVVHTSDGEHAMPLVYGRNIFAPADYRMGHGTWFAWTGKNKAGQPVALWDVVWKSGDVPADVQSVEVRSEGRAAAPVLFAVTGVR